MFQFLERLKPLPISWWLPAKLQKKVEKPFLRLWLSFGISKIAVGQNAFFTGPRCLWGPVYGSRCLYVTPSLPPYKTFGWNFADVTLEDDDINSILADDANRAIWSWWSLFRWWSCPMWGRQGGGTGVAWNVGAGVLVSCDLVGDNIWSWTIGEVTFFIEMVVDEWDDRVEESLQCWGWNLYSF